MNIIESFGISGSGKTYFRKKINFRGVHSYRSFLYLALLRKKNLSLVERLSLFYFLFIKNDFIKNIKSFFKYKKKNFEASKNLKKPMKNPFNIYKNICNKEYKRLKGKKLIFCKFVEKTIDNLNCNKQIKKTLIFWFKEEFCSYYNFSNFNSKKITIFDSEGFLQRLILYLYYSKENEHNYLIDNYIKLMPKIKYVLVFNVNKKFFEKKNHLDLKLNFMLQKKIFLKIKNKISTNYSNKIKFITNKNFLKKSFRYE